MQRLCGTRALTQISAVGGKQTFLETGAFLAHNHLVQRRVPIVRIIWAVCLLVAGLNHARTLFLHGIFWNYGGVGRASAIYWSSLTVLDPVAAALLFMRPKAGIATTILLITTNVAHNLAVTEQYAPEGEFLTRAANPFLVSQIVFMAFVAATARSAWKGAASGTGQAATT